MKSSGKIEEGNLFVELGNQWQEFETLKLPYYYKKFQQEIIENFRKKKKQDLEKYKSKTPDYPRAITKRDLIKLADNNTIFLRNSHDLWKETQNVTDLIKPILFFYSWQQFAAFFIYTLFKWPNPARGHGVHYHSGKNPDNLREVTIEFQNKGFFRRLVDSFVILGHPTAYGSSIPMPAKTEMTYRENQIGLKIPIGKIKFVKILDFKPSEFNREFKKKFPRKYYGAHIDVLLTDFLIVFVASNIARYRPKLWNSILEGKQEEEAKFKLRVEGAYKRFNTGLISFFTTVWKEFKNLKSGSTPFSRPRG